MAPKVNKNGKISYQGKNGKWASCEAESFDPSLAHPNWVKANMPEKSLSTSSSDPVTVTPKIHYQPVIEDKKIMSEQQEQSTTAIQTSDNKPQKKAITNSYTVLEAKTPKLNLIQAWIASMGLDLHLFMGIFRGDWQTFLGTQLGRFSVPVLLLTLFIALSTAMCGRSPINVNPTQTAGESLGNGIRSGVNYGKDQILQNGIQPAQAQPDAADSSAP